LVRLKTSPPHIPLSVYREGEALKRW